MTAQKSGSQALQSVPLAIQAFGGEDLKERNISTVDDLVSAIPGAFEGQRQSVASRSYNLRGAGGSNANGDSPIGYYVDDVPFIVTNFGIAPPIRFQDLERVEVLRGPQGTLYGQGSSGGVFIFHTRDPDLQDFQFSGEASVGHTRGADNVNTEFAGAVSIPIVKDKLAIRVSGGHGYNPGWADVYYGPYDGTPDRHGANIVRNDDIRIVGLFKPTDNLSIRAQYWHFRPRQEFLGTMASVDPPYYQNTAGQPSFGNGDFKLYSLSAALDLDSFSITSATSYLKGNFGIYIPLSPSGFFSSQFYPKMFAQEVRANSTGAGPFHWVVGAQYQDGEGPQKNQLLNPSVSVNADNNTITKNWAVFGELSYDLLDGKLVPLVGLRYYHDKRTFEDSTSSLPSTKGVTTWRVNLSYLPTDNLTMFITAATGFRAGIVQSQAQVLSLQAAGVPASTQLEPETSTNYEIGLKWRTPDRNVSVGLNGYITKFKDMQTNTPGGISGVNGFSNFGDATTKGIDFEFHWRTPLTGLSLNAVGNVNDGKYDRVNAAVQAALPLFRPGSRIVNSIEYNYRLDASYNGHVSEDVSVFGNLAWSRNGNRLQSTGIIADPYSQISATLGVRYKAYELALIGDNLGDERGPTIVGTNGPLSGSGPTPRTIGMRFRVDFQ
ncbi:TonB-dependent receptor [Sphingomonas sp.]|uniref:TonB-dependent receptor n=1 Tax=Sphingomonas sp. TaxID=28214 RepID=UPI001B018044|nr:TonB-dependent receptor [Sphingomonas sp.]MBO9711723.1 TonB-dependent receptor [Sphingomonas sp.]